ncbi:hypothetical protein CPB83DRAFT_842682 [Crepidotus variabilis]|uniref:Uncharacterized protein n=1 Tax=Crepidotus variabilis TaxID=179855 RepID=A0A9P6ESX0_9AGAR|nr:hypothetical protein CPB83DRAFT_842682 [Crepidotus variabilis]
MSEALSLGFEWPLLVAFMDAMTSKQGGSLRPVEIQYSGSLLGSPRQSKDDALDKAQFKQIPDSAKSLKSRMIDNAGSDLAEKLRVYHDL